MSTEKVARWIGIGFIALAVLSLLGIIFLGGIKYGAHYYKQKYEAESAEKLQWQYNFDSVNRDRQRYLNKAERYQEERDYAQLLAQKSEDQRKASALVYEKKISALKGLTVQQTDSLQLAISPDRKTEDTMYCYGFEKQKQLAEQQYRLDACDEAYGYLAIENSQLKYANKLCDSVIYSRDSAQIATETLLSMRTDQSEQLQQDLSRAQRVPLVKLFIKGFGWASWQNPLQKYGAGGGVNLIWKDTYATGVSVDGFNRGVMLEFGYKISFRR